MFLKNTHKQFLFGTGFSGAYFLVRPPRGGISTKERAIKGLHYGRSQNPDCGRFENEPADPFRNPRRPLRIPYADDGMQALELLHSEFDIDLLLLDINMPRLDGFGVLEVMKQRN